MLRRQNKWWEVSVYMVFMLFLNLIYSKENRTMYSHCCYFHRNMFQHVRGSSCFQSLIRDLWGGWDEPNFWVIFTSFSFPSVLLFFLGETFRIFFRFSSSENPQRIRICHDPLILPSTCVPLSFFARHFLSAVVRKLQFLFFASSLYFLSLQLHWH